MIETHENFPSQIVGSIRRLFTVLFKNKKKKFRVSMDAYIFDK